MTNILTFALCFFVNWLFLQVGTLPLDVGECAMALESGETVDDLIEAALSVAARDLAAFLHKPILKALKRSPDGVSTDKFAGVEVGPAREGNTLPGDRVQQHAAQVGSCLDVDDHDGCVTGEKVAE